MNKHKKLRAFTLIELLIVLALIGVMVATLMPNLTPMISKAKSIEAQLQLQHVHTLQKTFFYTHSKYSAELKDISFEHGKLVSEGGNANYRIEIVSATHNTFKAVATAVADFDGDGIFNVWEVDQDKILKEVTPD